jgi:uncharacterized repeat protein (TIGR04052 family)
MFKHLVLAAPFVLSSLAGCTGDSDDDGSTSSSSGASGPISVALRFDAKAGTDDVACGASLTGIGSSASTIRVSDLRFYIHDLRLLAADGTETPVALAQDGLWQKDNVALLDFETGAPACSDGTAATHKEVTGTAPAGTYTGVAFRLGVPEALNHQDTATAPAPMNLTPLWWNWNGGYKFLKLDLTSTGSPGGWFVHVGSTGCTPEGNAPTSCAASNRPEVRLTSFELDHEAVLFDIRALLASSNVDMNGGGAPGCMSGQTDPECASLFGKFGLPIGATPAGTQSVFSAVHHHEEP